MKKLYESLSLTLATMLMLASVAFAQDRVVTGTVADETGTGMPGVNVLVKGTPQGTVTDTNGAFSISVPGDATLVITFVGYKTSEVSVGDRTTVNVALEPDVSSLDEVVVTGYSIDKRREITGSVSTVKAKDLTVAPTGNVEQMLQGRVPGVTVITNGQPGSTSQVRVRGFGSFRNNNPLYIVDGVPTEDIQFLAPDDIETTTVLKDAAAASIYGARASSGVIVYTTKRGKKGDKLAVTYDNMFGVTDPGKGPDLLAPQDFADWTYQAFRNTARQNGLNEEQAIVDAKHPQFGPGPNAVVPDFLNVGGVYGVSGPVDLDAERLKYNNDPRQGAIYQVVRANKQGTDWYKEITRSAPVQRHSLGISGGGEASRFYVGLSAQDQKGILLEQDFKRYAARFNSEFDVLKNLRIGENVQLSYISVRGLLQGTGPDGQADGGTGAVSQENDLNMAYRMPSIIPVYDEFGGYAGTAAKGFNNPRNPVAARMGRVNDRAFQTQAFGNVYLEFDPIPGLTLRTSIGGRYTAFDVVGYNRWTYENSENNSSFSFNQNNGYNFSWVFTNTAAFKKAFGDHTIDLLVGQEALNTGRGWSKSSSGLNPFDYDPNFINQGNIASPVSNSNQFLGVNFSSYFGKVNYTFKEKYIIGGVIRRDGSSRFGSNNRYGVFPAGSVAWRISSENFMQGIEFVSDLKIRGGYGTMGNSNAVDPQNQYTTYGPNLANSSYDISGINSGNGIPTGFYRTRIGNPDAKWETNVTKNLGIDALLFDGKLDVIIDLWEKDTKDLLLQLPLPAPAGFNAAAPFVNVARMLNRGIDLGIIVKQNLTPDLSMEVNVNGSFLKNEITEISDGLTNLPNVNPGFRGITPIRNELGGALSGFYGFKVAGLWQSNEEVLAANAADGDATTEFQAGAAQGRFRFEDINGDGRIDLTNDRTNIGSPIPNFTGGLTLKLKYKSFDFETYLYTSQGNEIFHVAKLFTDFYPTFPGAAISERVKDSWSPTNTDASLPIFESASNFSTNTQSNSFYVEDGSYWRLQNISFGYTLPTGILQRLKMTKLRIFISSNNVFTITNYSGPDPSIGGNADTNFGIDVGNYPITRSYTAGLNLAF